MSETGGTWKQKSVATTPPPLWRTRRGRSPSPLLCTRPHARTRPFCVPRAAPVRAPCSAFQQGTLQGAYLIMAIRAVGLDAGAMGGFNTDMADEIFLQGKNWKSNFLCNIGYGDLEGIKGPRLYRYDFEEVCQII